MHAHESLLALALALGATEAAAASAAPEADLGAAPPLALALDQPPRVPRWDRGERALLFGFVLTGLLDAYQTSRIPEGYREANPLLSSWAGDRPEVWQVALFKGAGAMLTIDLTRRHGRHGGRKKVLAAMTLLQLAVVVHNERRTGGILVE